MCMYMCVCVWMCVYVYMCIYLCACICMFVGVYVYIYTFVLTSFSCIYWFLILTISTKKVFRQNFWRGRIQSPVGHLAWSFLQTGLSGLLFFRKGCCLELLGRVLNTTLLRLLWSEYDFLFFFFISWNIQLWSASKYLWWRLALCGDQTIDLQDDLIGWFLYGLGFCQGYFRTDYSIVLNLEAAIAKCLLLS